MHLMNYFTKNRSNVISIFINDLPPFLNYCYSAFLADDATIHTNRKTLKYIEENLQSDANSTKHWCKQNKNAYKF